MKGQKKQPSEFTAFFPFCGLGAGARGFLQAAARLGEHEAHFRNLGGIDIDELACADFEYLTGVKALHGDINAVTPEQLRAYAGERRPDVVFSSPPCKGFSKLLSKDLAESEKYQELNRLVLQAIFLVCETWKDDPPPAIIIENVPGIQTRGALLLAQVKSLLRTYGYVFHDGTHNCGEIGGLGQNRVRYLLVARREKAVPAFIYRPPRLRVKGCGEILESLPMPEDDEAGEMHDLPRLSWLNWVRLALIPAGGDWRDLPASVPEALLAQTAKGADSFKGRPGLMAVNEWDEPMPAVIGKASVSGSNGTAAVADPRVPAEVPKEWRNPVPAGRQRRSVFCRWHVNPWNEPGRTVAGPGMNGGYGVADPRVAEPEDPRQVKLGLEHEPRRGTFGVTAWDEPSPTVRGISTVRNGPAAVADPRLQMGIADPSRGGALGVIRWDEPAPTITGNVRAGSSNTPGSVADPRVDGACALALGSDNPNRHEAKFRVTPWEEPAHAITAARPVTSGGPSIADPRLRCTPRAGMYGVLSWRQAATTIIGNARVDNGAYAVADPRKALPKGKVPIIVAEDGTWHRPLTTLELAALQGLPARVNGEPLSLATMATIGKRGAKAPSNFRERIGNAVPVGAARAIGESILTALLAASLGTWTLSPEAIWVRKDGVDENEANAPWLPEDLGREEARFENERW